MSTNYSPTIVTDGAVFVGDALMPSISEPGTRLYNRAGVDSADVKLLIHGNVGSGQSFTDSSLSNHTITASGNVIHLTSGSKFSGGYFSFDGTGDYLTAASSSDFNLLEEDFTIDMWINFGRLANMDICDIKGYADGLSFRLQEPGGAGKIGCYLENNNHVWTWTPALSTWYHLALVRYGATLKCYVNGIALTATSGGNPSGQSIAQGALQIGQWLTGGGAQDFEGYMDEFRLTKGVALWTQDFTPPARRDTLSISDGMMYNGSCVDFDGTDDYIDLGSIAFGTKDISIATWFTLDAFDDDYACIFNNRTSSAGNAGFEIRQRTSGTKVELQFDWGAGSNVVSTGALSTGTWYHIVATLDRSGYLRGYLNGVEFGTPLDISSYSAISITNDNSAFIGADGYLSNFWNGRAGDLKIYENTVLSASQVKEIYNSSKVIIPSNVSQTNLMGWWPLVDGAGDYAYDGSGNGNDGTLTNMTSADWLTGQTGCPQLVEGYNRPMLFPGATTDYVAVGNTSEFCFGTSDFSFGAWIKTSNTATFNMVFDALQPLNKGWQFGVYGSSPYMRLWASTGSAQVNVDSSTNVCDGQWHHVGFTSYAGSPQLVTLYVDGSADASSGSMGALNMVGGAYASWIGGQVAGPNYPFNGLINEVVLYDALLSSTQMAALAATGPNGGPLPPDPASGPSSLPSTSSLKGYWRNDGDVTWTDRSGEGNNGTVGGSPDVLLFKQGYNGQKNVNTGRDGQGFPLKFKNVGAIGFNGSDNLIDIPHSTVFDSTVFSYCSWVYVPGDTTADGKVAHLSNNSAGNGWGTWQIRSSTTTNQLYYQTNNAGTWQTYTMNNYFTGAGWYYICVTHIQGSNPTVYRDAEVFAGTGTVTQDFDFGTDPLYIGCRKSASSFYEFWNGQIANGQYYNRVLSQAEIKQNYNAQKSRFT